MLPCPALLLILEPHCENTLVIPEQFTVWVQDTKPGEDKQEEKTMSQCQKSSFPFPCCCRFYHTFKKKASEKTLSYTECLQSHKYNISQHLSNTNSFNSHQWGVWKYVSVFIFCKFCKTHEVLCIVRAKVQALNTPVSLLTLSFFICCKKCTPSVLDI